MGRLLPSGISLRSQCPPPPAPLTRTEIIPPGLLILPLVPPAQPCLPISFSRCFIRALFFLSCGSSLFPGLFLSHSIHSSLNPSSPLEPETLLSQAHLAAAPQGLAIMTRVKLASRVLVIQPQLCHSYFPSTSPVRQAISATPRAGFKPLSPHRSQLLTSDFSSTSHTCP